MSGLKGMHFANTNLNNININRYLRQIALPEIGHEGQLKLSKASVLCVGAGGLGSPALLYLCAAGVGRLGVIDDDCVSLSNLQRQVLFNSAELGRNKSECASEHLLALNPEVKIEYYPLRLTANNARDLFSGYDVIIDGTDNFTTKYLINDTCVALGKPLVYGSVLQFEGRVSVFNMAGGPCYRCLYPVEPTSTIPNCAEAGVLGAVAGLVGSLQALEVIKLIVKHPALKPLAGRLTLIDAAAMEFSTFKVKKLDNCPTCSHPDRIILHDSSINCSTTLDDLSAPELDQYLRSSDPPHLIDIREEEELFIEPNHDAVMIPQAAHLPFSKLRAGILPERTDRPIVLYCHAGVRSRIALSILRQAGFINIRHLRGGFVEWCEWLQAFAIVRN